MHAAGRGNRCRGTTPLMLLFTSSPTRIPGETLRLHQKCASVRSRKKVNLALWKNGLIRALRKKE